MPSRAASLARRRGSSALSVIRRGRGAFFHERHSSLVRPQATHQPVRPSNLQISMQGDFKMGLSLLGLRTEQALVMPLLARGADHRIAHQHGDRDRTDTTWHRRDPAGDLRDGVEIDIAHHLG